MKFRTQYGHYQDPGENLSDEIVTEPGQAFTTREIYERFIVTGRVMGVARQVSFDSDSKDDVTFDDLIPRPLDLTDIDAEIENLTRMRQQREQAYKQALEEEKRRKEKAASQGTSVAE